jgi:hypothetical protein
MGIFFPAEGRFDLILSVRYGTTAHLAQWKIAMQRASEMLFFATDGQHQLGQIFICPDRRGGGVADLWLFEDTGTSTANARIWLPGTHVELMHDERWHPFTILHELGHYLYGLRDEYTKGIGSGPASCIGRRPPTPEEIAANPTVSPRLPGACIMEGLWDDGDYYDGPIRYDGTVTDFCVECNHDRGCSGWNCGVDDPEPQWDDVPHDTVQSEYYKNSGPEPYAGTSCWAKMVDHYPDLVLPENLPDPVPPVTSPATIGWTVLEPEERFVLAIDRSTAFFESAPWAWAPLRASLKRWARRARSDERYGAVAFARGVQAYGLVKIRPSTLLTAEEQIDAIEPAAVAGTNMGRALTKALDMMTAGGTRACSQVVVLISGSRHSGDPEPLDLIPRLLRAGIRVVGLAIGLDADVTRLSALCQATGGTYLCVGRFWPGGNRSLAGAMAQLHAMTHPDEALVTVAAGIPGTWSPSLPGLPGSPDLEIETHIEREVAEAHFEVLDGRGKRVGFELTAPDSAPEAVEAAGGRVRSPAEGTWKVRIPTAGPLRGNPADRNRTVIVSVRESRVHLVLTAARQSYRVGETVTLSVQASALMIREERVLPERIVSGYRCRAEVEDPDGELTEIDFQSEGSGGRYEAEFPAAKAGQYAVHCVADSRGLSPAQGSGWDLAPTPDDEDQEGHVPEFLRTAILTIRVEEAASDEEAEPGLTLEQGETRDAVLGLGGTPWVPGVSRLHLGRGVAAHERPGDTIAGGRPSFRIEVDPDAPPGVRDGIVVTGTDRYRLEALATVEGDPIPAPVISPERRTLPGGFLRRLLEPPEEDE